MPNPSITLDHVHFIRKNAAAAAQWHIDKLDAKIVRSGEVKGAPQLYVEIGGGSMLIARGERPGEGALDKPGLER